ncbi:non-oxidative hydroxyarylic acid decarboxylases subunit D [Streptomyces sp. SCL15-4]|uniref:non-oxidative hydroxyarylic acid decarboxylases subunit D n=1 Tax=Streptomyces sp. SCL15-4 TaxID=2967221 RepID=UPI0029673762|nr:non-oxidative hydroxyarylic acid decarboxylases subunit D [Streptomyces sp. SCL15-4]
MTDCCPRCAHESLRTLHSSPVPGVWDVVQCGRCLYTWRTSEPDRRTRRAAYPEAFRLTPEDMANAAEVPAVPPLRAGDARQETGQTAGPAAAGTTGSQRAARGR